MLAILVARRLEVNYVLPLNANEILTTVVQRPFFPIIETFLS
jgi:hypothetical protein